MTAVAVAINPPSTVDRLVRDNLGLVQHIANQFYSPLGYDELVAAGNVGLVIAAQRYDESRGVKFSTLAGWWIKAKIAIAIQEDSGANKTMNVRKLFWGIKRAAHEVGEDPEAIASYLGVRVKEVIMFGAHLLRGMVRLDAHYKGSDAPLSDLLLVDETTPESLTIERLDHARHLRKLRTALRSLKPFERYIIQHRFLEEPRLSLVAVGADIGMSHEQVRKIELMLLAKLRKALA